MHIQFGQILSRNSQDIVQKEKSEQNSDKSQGP